MLDSLRSLVNKVRGLSPEELSAAEEAAQGAGLRLHDVLNAHAEWKRRLDAMLENGSEELDPARIGSDNLCELGKWLYGAGKERFGHLEEYREALQAHAAFHRTASEVVKYHLLGDRDTARELLKTRFRQASNKNRVALVHLFVMAKYL